MSLEPPPFPTSLGFIGLGAMGFPMLTNLWMQTEAESTIHIYDVDSTVLDKFINQVNGWVKEKTYATIIRAGSAREVCEKSDCIISIVPEGSHVRDVYLNPQTGLLACGNTSNKIFIDCSTIDITTSLQVSAAVKASMNNPASTPVFFDAPVSGGTAGASKGTLTFMLGCDSNSSYLPLLRRILGTMGTNIHPMGGPSLGLASKLSNNYLSGMIALATSEAMNLGMRLGVDSLALSRCFQTSSGANWVNETVNPVPGVCPDAVTSRGYDGGFKVQLMKKDMGLAINAAREVGAKLVLGDAGLSAYAAASEDPRCRDKDSRVVYRWLGGVEPDGKEKKYHENSKK
ncbi:3-hydroxyisobutyrate dehydrogenase [Crucibulum laeve]|uniref:3-hydroxyisobutyrate dehydrogenase n=1 Tax=Crucibulum laeve TaxID=68775 RepID=A0A5C3MJZ0_9AGAR|nr:3-hydroxyisobutyrate dehydrogenase [Crucibulum laeve]